MQNNTLYDDGLVTITPAGITFHKYYIIGTSKTVPVSDITEIDVYAPSLINGKWRIWGSSTLTTWFPLDWDRPKRDAIFIARLRSQSMNIGFTVKDSARVKQVFAGLGLLSRGKI